MSSVFVTVGMGPWPFDRLVAAVAPLCAEHDVFVQTGTSSVIPPCPHQPYLGPAETLRRITEADVVITHGGNTVRLAQRAGKVPIAVAREAARGEMRNDHQVAYLTSERSGGRVRVRAGDDLSLPAAVAGHADTERRMLATAPPLPARTDPGRLGELLDSAVAPPAGPFERHPLARYRWAWGQLAARTGRHLDLGVGDGDFTRALHRETKLEVVAVDAHPDYLRVLRSSDPELALARVATALPFADGAFGSVSALDVLEHVADEPGTLAELHRVLRPGGLLVLTVPARHAFSVLDPDDAKLTRPRLHRAVYQRRFGRAEYERRFVDAADGLRGDMAWTRSEHTNYRAEDLFGALATAGFVPAARDGAGFYWRLLQVPALLLPARLAKVLDAPQRLDARLFRRANLFLTATRP
ncbi:MAG TPA: methyltransferase domain-containing protein [Mycobacteriales bacterium]|nr:methyltransferase domain-containing protein [Mycobacteriales bacterium]